MQKPPLLFIHGMWATPKVWDWFADRYRARGYEVQVPALPFHDVPPGTPPDPLLATIGVQDYVDALIAAARDLGRPALLVGHSLGAVLAQKMAEATGAAGLALLSPAPTAQTGSLALAPLRTIFGIATTKQWWKSPIKIDPDRARWGIFNTVPPVDSEKAISEMVWDSGRVLFQLSMPFADKSRATRVDYARLGMPALVLAGDHDRIVPVAVARATARQLRGVVDYREIEGAGHWLFHEPVRERVATEIDLLLQRIEARPD